MLEGITWGPERRADRRERKARFVCTDPPKEEWVDGAAVPHPRRWELRLQSRIRKFRCRQGDFSLVGRDDDGLAAVCFWYELDGPGYVFIRAAAVEMRYRNRGGACADELVSRVLAQITERAWEQGLMSVIVEAHIHRSNQASKHFAARTGFSFLRLHGEESELWALEIERASDPGRGPGWKAPDTPHPRQPEPPRVHT